MTDATPTHRNKMSSSHWVVLGVWGVMCGWLVISLLTGVISALFFGDGPIVEHTMSEVTATAPDAPKVPSSADESPAR